jgi:transcriptional regulator with PAS, ATPase and Fis domain
MTDLATWRSTYAPEIVGEHPALVGAIDIIRRVADTSCSVLISGESGTGKELMARAVHAASPRADRPFVAINCAAIPETMIESELFGHVRGAFTGASGSRAGRFAAADGGTLFLDEISEMPAAAQSKLLRVLQEGVITPVGSDDEICVDVRIVAATNRDLEAMAGLGDFRADLYYRINVIPVEMVPLRDRSEDIDALAANFLACSNERHSRRVTGFSAAAIRVLRTQPWRGNIRELGHAIERAVLLKGEGQLDHLGDLGLKAVEPHLTSIDLEDNPDSLDLRNALTSVEKSLISRALDKTNGNRTEAAALLGLNRTTLVEKIRKHAS